MDLTGYAILISVCLISIYDFYYLRKIKVTISKCFKSSLITLILSFFVTSFLGVLISIPFENSNFQHEHFLIFSLVLVILFNFYRINGRKISRGKIVRDKKGGFNNIIIGILILLYIFVFSSLIFYSIKFSFELWHKTMLLQEFGNYGLGGSLIVIINNILVTLFYPYANKVASVGLFSIGIFALWTFCFTSYFFIKSNVLKNKK